VLSTWVSLLVGTTAVLAFLGTGTVFVLSGRQKVRIDTLEHQNSDLRNDVGDRDRRIEFLEHENANKTHEIGDLRAHVKALERMKAGEAYFQAIHDQVEAHSAKVLANHARLESKLDAVLALLGDQRRKP
jgi:predicted  nucleic acid-binding Zn-ribbon protein